MNGLVNGLRCNDELQKSTLVRPSLTTCLFTVTIGIITWVRESPTISKIGLSAPPCLPLLCPQHVDFVIFIQFLAILPKMSPLKSTPNGKPCCATNFLIENISKHIIKSSNYVFVCYVILCIVIYCTTWSNLRFDIYLASLQKTKTID